LSKGQEKVRALGDAGIVAVMRSEKIRYGEKMSDINVQTGGSGNSASASGCVRPRSMKIGSDDMSTKLVTVVTYGGALV